MEQGMSMGTMPAGAQMHLDLVQAPWLELHAPGGIQVSLRSQLQLSTCHP